MKRRKRKEENKEKENALKETQAWKNAEFQARSQQTRNGKSDMYRYDGEMCGKQRGRGDCVLARWRDTEREMEGGRGRDGRGGASVMV